MELTKIKDLEKIAQTLPSASRISKSDRPMLDSVIKHIDGMDFSSIVNKITQKDPLISRVWTQEEAEIGVQLYKNFLFLNAKYSDNGYILPPSVEVDEIWHHHILDTRQYFIDCLAIFGEYFHHFPYFGMRGSQDNINLKATFEDTQSLHEKEFGVEMCDIWGL